eukprot:gene5644-7027_t
MIKNILSVLVVFICIINSSCLGHDLNIDENDRNFINERIRGGQIPYTLSYDYVVLGAGTAGSVVASKLSDKSSNKVLLVEEGPWALNPNIHNPNNWKVNWLDNPDPVVSKDFFSDPQLYMNNKVMSSPRAKVVGGCNSHNAMVTLTASNKDFSEWFNYTNNPIWSPQTFRESLRVIGEQFDIQTLNTNRVLLPEIRSGLEQSGYTFNPNGWGGIIPGSFIERMYMIHVDNSTQPATLTRQSTYTQFVEKDLETKSNLDVVTGEKAIYLNYRKNRQGKTFVRGVLIQNVGTKRYTYVVARKEVIVSMGAYESPKFLQLNGIGNKTLLQNHGIRVVVDSPAVGSNLRDQLFTLYFGKALSEAYRNITIPKRHPIWDGFHVFGTVNTTSVDYLMGVDFMGGRMSCSIENTKVKSSGYVEIQSSNHKLNPKFNENSFKEVSDREAMIAGVRECRRIEAKLVQMGVLDDSDAGAMLPNNASEQDILNHLKNAATSDFHPCCTVKMGPANDPSAPLDTELKVKGVENLRVIDASIFPTHIVGNPNMVIAAASLQISKSMLVNNVVNFNSDSDSDSD